MIVTDRQTEEEDERFLRNLLQVEGGMEHIPHGHVTVKTVCKDVSAAGIKHTHANLDS